MTLETATTTPEVLAIAETITHLPLIKAIYQVENANNAKQYGLTQADALSRYIGQYYNCSVFEKSAKTRIYINHGQSRGDKIYLEMDNNSTEYNYLYEGCKLCFETKTGQLAGKTGMAYMNFQTFVQKYL